MKSGREVSVLKKGVAIAVAAVLLLVCMLDRYAVIRGSVNMDVFMQGVTPEKLWGVESYDFLASESSQESADIFETAMKNNFEAGKLVIDAVLDGSF